MFKCEMTQIDNNSLRLVAGPSELNKIRKHLTIKNKSVQYQIKKCSDSITVAGDKEWLVAKLVERMKELKEQETVELYTDQEDGSIRVPFGLYSIGKCVGDFHLNKTFKPFKIEGMRYYQWDAVVEVTKYKRAMIQAATGSGKTYNIISLAVGAAMAGKRCIIVVPSEYLVGQMVDDLKPFWESVTGASGKRTPKLGSDILVVTANSAKKFIDVYDVVVIDEAHRVSCDTYQEFIMCADKAECIYTMTATPFRADGLDLILHALGGPVVYEFSVKKGIEEGYLTRPEIHCINIDTGLELGSRKMATTAYSKLIMNAKVYGAIFSSLEKALASGKNCIVMFKTVKAGEMFKKFCKGKIDFEVASGNYKKPLIDFRDGKTNILVACDKLIGEGISINQADVLFLLTQHTSDVMTYQSIGRVLRLFPGKEKAIIIDIAVKGYGQFERAREKRIAVYKDIISEPNQLIIKG